MTTTTTTAAHRVATPPRVALVALAAAGPLAIAALRGVLPYSTVDDTATAVAKIAAAPGAQAAVLGLGYLALLTLPLGVLVVARVAVATRPVLGTVAAVVAWTGFVSLFAGAGLDAIAHAGARAGVPADALVRLVTAFDADPVTGLPGLVFVVGHILGAVLLGVAVRGAVPGWAAIALIVSQPLHLVFAVVVPNRALDVLAWGLTAVGFAAVAARAAR